MEFVIWGYMLLLVKPSMFGAGDDVYMLSGMRGIYMWGYGR